MSKINSSFDVEQKHLDDERLRNNVVATFAWQVVNVRVQERVSQRPKCILEGSSGFVEAGEIVALMGAKQSGKADVEGHVYLDGERPSLSDFRKLTSYVEQDDARIGSLTVEETLSFAARLSLPDRRRLIQHLIHSFGLQDSAHSLIGTPIRKGISGGQKRRVSVASQLITAPKVLFLDEPTSGLDSAASFEVISFIRDIARQYKARCKDSVTSIVC
ncbi:MAG: hypothetical protein MMC23_007811 [Stictis urceolatum]|nr:hypothetical protein [Stictis urceolata]